MTHDEAMKLARRVTQSSLAPSNPNWISVAERVDIARKLAAYILSGDMKREIENAAIAMVADEYSNSFGDEAVTAFIRALITSAKTADTEG